MNICTKMIDLMPIIYPKFYTCHDASKNELVFLDIGESKILNIDVLDKTQCEALVNHYHLFEKMGERNYEKIIEIGRAIANNLYDSLLRSFPSKLFVIYLEVSTKNSTILRFHQIWEGELPYFDMTQIYDDVEIFEIGGYNR